MEGRNPGANVRHRLDTTTGCSSDHTMAKVGDMQQQQAQSKAHSQAPMRRFGGGQRGTVRAWRSTGKGQSREAGARDEEMQPGRRSGLLPPRNGSMDSRRTVAFKWQWGLRALGTAASDCRAQHLSCSLYIPQEGAVWSKSKSAARPDERFEQLLSTFKRFLQVLDWKSGKVATDFLLEELQNAAAEGRVGPAQHAQILIAGLFLSPHKSLKKDQVQPPSNPCPHPNTVLEFLLVNTVSLLEALSTLTRHLSARCAFCANKIFVGAAECVNIGLAWFA